MDLMIIDEIRKEFKVNDDGSVTCSIRGASRVCGVSHVALLKHFSSGNLKSSKLTQTLTSKGFKCGDFSVTGIHDTALSIMIEYYAFDAERYCTEQARDIYRTFAAIGIRTWIKQQLGYKEPENTFLRSTPRQWSKMFADEYYDELSRLTGLSWDKKTHVKPMLWAKITYELVYDFLTPSDYKTIKDNQKKHGGNLNKVHQFLAPLGISSLMQHLQLVLNILTAVSDLGEAKRLITQSITKNYQQSCFKEVALESVLPVLPKAKVIAPTVKTYVLVSHNLRQENYYCKKKRNGGYTWIDNLNCKIHLESSSKDILDTVEPLIVSWIESNGVLTIKLEHYQQEYDKRQYLILNRKVTESVIDIALQPSIMSLIVPCYDTYNCLSYQANIATNYIKL